MGTSNNTLQTLTQLQLHQYRVYHCLWPESYDKRHNKLKLLQNHLREHTGHANDELKEVLMRDQAKALKNVCKTNEISSLSNTVMFENVLQISFNV